MRTALMLMLVWVGVAQAQGSRWTTLTHSPALTQVALDCDGVRHASWCVADLAIPARRGAGMTAVQPTPRVDKGPDSLAVNQSEYDGWKLYHTYCDRCHGQDAVGTTLAPNLRRSVGPDGSVTHDGFIQKTSDGVADKGMPAWKTTLGKEQMETIWTYLRARSSGRLAPGRPHVVSGATSGS